MSDEHDLVHPVAITGMHRSGTSMITRGLHESGLHLIGGDADALLAAADDNPEGFWENKAIVTCNDDLLEAAGGSWDNPPALPPQAVDDPRVTEIVEPATAALAGLAENERWGFKDPRLCLTAAFWLDLQPDLRFVICVRNPLEVALSLKRRNQNSYSLGLSLWERYYQSILELVPAERRIVTHYDSYFLDPVGELGRVCAFVGLEPAVLDVRSDLRHHDVGVSLDEANLNPTIRELYRGLCAEAGAPEPRPTVVDEGQVRRLVLDGTVAARHAEQRQQALDRMEERLAEVRKSEEELKIELARVRRESESRRAEIAHLSRSHSETTARFEALIATQREMVEQNRRLEEQNRRLVDTTDTIAEMADGIRGATQRITEGTRATHERLDHMAAITDAIHVKLRAVEDTVSSGFFSTFRRRVRRVLGRGARKAAGPTRRVAGATARRGAPLAKRTAKATAKRLPEPMQHNLRRVRRAVADGQAGTRVKERARRVVSTLPDPAQKVARKSTDVVRGSRAVPAAKRVGRGVARRLPAPARRRLRSLVSTSPAADRRPAVPAKKAAPAPRPKQSVDGRATAVPKGPAAYKWQKGYERLVAEHIGADTAWAVVTPGTKSPVDKVGARRATVFPSADGGAPAADSLSLIAILEALRVAGTERLVLPEGARPWFREHPELRDHVARHHPTVIDREVAGAVFDLTCASDSERRGLLAEVNELAAPLDAMPSVLDWTGGDISGELPGFTTFQPPRPDGLPYLDESVEIVVTTADHDAAEAGRVASVGVITVEVGGGHLRVVDVHPKRAAATPAPTVVVVVPPTDDEGLIAAIRERVAECGGTLVFGRAGDADVAGADVVVCLEAGVLPLPGSITFAAAAANEAPDALVVAKVIDRNGHIESAGGMVFTDGSVAGIAAGTLEVRAPWHEFVRPVCWGGGMVAASLALRGAVPRPADDDGFLGWCGDVWVAGHTVSYLPQAVVVRTAPAGAPAPAPSWEPLLRSRPARPATLGDGVWRYLLANDDPAALAGKVAR